MTEVAEQGAEVRSLRPGEKGTMSVLGNLKERREEIKKAATTTIAVPRWDDPVIKVEFKPVDHAIIRRGQSMAEKVKGDRRSEAEVNANVDVLIAGCVRVFAEIDGKEYSLKPGDWESGEFTTFDHELAENLGCGSTAREVVRALYITDGDIISTASALGEFSGYREQEADEKIVGE